MSDNTLGSPAVRRRALDDNDDTEHSSSLRRTGASLLIAGPLVAVAGGRWGSYIGIVGTPVYLADLLVVFGLLMFALGSVQRTNLAERTGANAVPLIVKAISVASLANLSMGIARADEITLLTLRDAAPWVYFAFTPLVYLCVRALGQERVMSYIRAACLVHTAWFPLAIFGTLPEVEAGALSGVPLFTTRGDFDVLVCGLSVAVFFLSMPHHRVWAAVLSLLNISAAFASGSRGGLIAATVLVLVVIVAVQPFASRSKGSARVAAVCVVSAASVGVLVRWVSAPPQWAVGLQKLIPNDSAVYQTGQNTLDARLRAWELVISHSERSGNRALGSGFGSSPILESGAVRYLSGDTSVRAAHNFLVTWYGFLGIGGVLFGLACLTLAATLVLRARSGNSIVAGVGAGLCAAIVLAGLAGVILESPFGYMNYAMGLAMATQGSKTPATHVDPRPAYGSTH